MRDTDANAEAMGRRDARRAKVSDTYTCGWCGWRGKRIEEQIAEMVLSVVPPVIRYVCWRCGMEVYPDA